MLCSSPEKLKAAKLRRSLPENELGVNVQQPACVNLRNNLRKPRKAPPDQEVEWGIAIHSCKSEVAASDSGLRYHRRMLAEECSPSHSDAFGPRKIQVPAEPESRSLSSVPSSRFLKTSCPSFALRTRVENRRLFGSA
jgi:hypothetical protein